jgi:hypothetical protein
VQQTTVQQTTVQQTTVQQPAVQAPERQESSATQRPDRACGSHLMPRPAAARQPADPGALRLPRPTEPSAVDYHLFAGVHRK